MCLLVIHGSTRILTRWSRNGWMMHPTFPGATTLFRFTIPLDANSVRELKTKISTQIAKCSCVVILAGMYVNYSRWIDFEIDTAIEMGKPIIGVRPWGQERVPKKVADNSDVMVGWNSSSVVRAIRDYSI